ncbi:MAG: acyl-CoA dehydrogenase family protein [Thermoplasmatota archaeon]
MDLQPTAMERAFLEGLGPFRAGVDPGELERSAGVPRELLLECGRLGLMGVMVPRAYGGSGLGAVAYALAIEEVSRVSASLGAVLSVHNSVGALPILEFGTDEQRSELLPRVCSGECLAGFAVTEAGAGSDVSAIATSAERLGDQYILNGVKLFISNGSGEVVNVLASTGSGRGASGQSMFILRRGDPGFRVGGVERKMGLHADETCELVLEECRIPAGRLLGREGEGFKQAMRALDVGRIGIGAQAVGAARGAMDAAVEAARESGRPVPQATQFTLAELAAELEAARLLVLWAADRHERGLGATVPASMAKLRATEVANDVAVRLVKALGPGALAQPNPLERLFRDSKVFEIYEGTSEIHRLIISRRLLGRVPWERGP